MRKYFLKRHIAFILVFLVMALLVMAHKYLQNKEANASATEPHVISVASFGAKPVEMYPGFNSTAAFQKALNSAIFLQEPLYIPTGMFEVDSGQLQAVVPSGKKLEIIGNGKKSIIRRRSGSVYKDSQDILSITSSNGKVKQITLKNFAIDGNATGNPLPDGNGDPYLWQHSSSIRIHGARSSAKIKNVTIEDLTCYDAVADHIYFPGNGDSFVETVWVKRFYAYKRARTRSDLTVTGGLKNLYVTDSTMTRLETELNRPYAGTFVMRVSRVNITQKLDISGDHMIFYGDHIVAAHIGLWKVKGSIRDSELHFAADAAPPRADQLYTFHFNNTDFYFPVAPEGKIYPFTLNYSYDAVFEKCRFIIDAPENRGSVFQGWALEAKPGTNERESHRLRVLNCQFDKRFSENIHLDRSGSAILKNNAYSGSNAAIFMSGSKKKPLKVEIDGGTFRDLTGSPFLFDQVDGLFITMKNLAIPLEMAGYKKTGPRSDPIHVINQRILLAAKPPIGGGIKGDRVKLLESKHQTASYWVADHSDSVATKWTPIPSLSSKISENKT